MQQNNFVRMDRRDLWYFASNCPMKETHEHDAGAVPRVLCLVIICLVIDGLLLTFRKGRANGRNSPAKENVCKGLQRLTLISSPFGKYMRHLAFGIVTSKVAGMKTFGSDRTGAEAT